MKTELDRRSFLKSGATAAGLFTLSSPLLKAFAESCGIVTPPQVEGPFYPGESRFDQNVDLTRVPGKPGKAEGQVIYIRGRVQDIECRPIPNANVEIWQACSSGRYNSPKDPNPAPLDPNFRYWAETFTNEKGEFSFKSIVPGAYPADKDWDRPPHIHFRVAALGYRELITQMYFKGHPLNAGDLILQDLREEERNTVIVDFLSADADLEPGALTGTFDIVLKKVRS